MRTWLKHKYTTDKPMSRYKAVGDDQGRKHALKQLRHPNTPDYNPKNHVLYLKGSKRWWEHYEGS